MKVIRPAAVLLLVATTTIAPATVSHASPVARLAPSAQAAVAEHPSGWLCRILIWCH